MLTRLTVQNYRSLQNIDLTIDPFTSIVGPNGSGKTSILRAISSVFGAAWPSLRSFRVPQDFTGFDASLPIEITGWFSPAYSYEDIFGKVHEIQALRLSCKPYKRSGRWGNVGDLHVELEALDASGKVPSIPVGPLKKGVSPTFRQFSVTSELREHSQVLVIDHRRSLVQHLPYLRGSVLGRLLEPARRDFDKQVEFREAYDAALAIIRTDAVREVETMIMDTAKRMLGFLGSEVGKTLDIGFGFADPANPLNSLRLEYRESGMVVPGDELGLGIQSAIVVGIFEAYRQLGTDIDSVLIEEPEMYLHPQAQRYFYRLLREMVEAGSCQIICTTHSPVFADVNLFESLRVTRREPGSPSAISYIAPPDIEFLTKERARQKISARFDTARNEVLFASRALLVEGHGDRLAALTVAEKLDIDIDAEGFSVIDCGGKNAIPLVAGICRALAIPFSVLHDEDIWPLESSVDEAKQEEENKAAEIENKRIVDAIRANNSIFILTPSLESVLGIGRSAKDKPIKVLEMLQNMAVGEVPAALVKSVESLCIKEINEAPAEGASSEKAE